MPHQRDLAEQIFLGDDDRLHPDHFEDRQEHRDHRPPAPLLLENPQDIHRFIHRDFHKLFLQVADHVGDGHVGRLDFVDRPVLGPVQQLAERLDQIE